jgi:hypothetical protein
MGGLIGTPGISDVVVQSGAGDWEKEDVRDGELNAGRGFVLLFRRGPDRGENVAVEIQSEGEAGLEASMSDRVEELEKWASARS